MLKVLKNAAPEIKDCKILTLIKYKSTVVLLNHQALVEVPAVLCDGVHRGRVDRIGDRRCREKRMRRYLECVEFCGSHTLLNCQACYVDHLADTVSSGYLSS